MNEVGTLKELDVKPGDVVYMHDARDQYTVDENPHKTPGQVNTTIGFHYDWRLATIISRATPAPKLWRDMTDAEKGELLLAHYEGKDIQWTYEGWFEWGDIPECLWADECAYRVRHEPKIETVSVYSNDCAYGHLVEAMRDHRITFNLIDGKPDCASIKMEPIE